MIDDKIARELMKEIEVLTKRDGDILQHVVFLDKCRRTAEAKMAALLVGVIVSIFLAIVGLAS